METLWRDTGVFHTGGRNALISEHVWQLPNHSCFFAHSANYEALQSLSGNRQGSTAISDVPGHRTGTCLFMRGQNSLGKQVSLSPHWLHLNTGLSLKVVKPCAIQLKKTRARFMKYVTSMHTRETCKDVNLSQDAMGPLLLSQRGKGSSCVERLYLLLD